MIVSFKGSVYIVIGTPQERIRNGFVLTNSFQNHQSKHMEFSMRIQTTCDFASYLTDLRFNDKLPHQ